MANLVERAKIALTDGSETTVDVNLTDAEFSAPIVSRA